MEVSDSGPGIDETLREQLFQRPSALSQREAREQRGGLGLLIVRRMLELHGGGIRFLEAKQGACFRFYVPL
jgi:signal transduction histidine kinase